MAVLLPMVIMMLMMMAVMMMLLSAVGFGDEKRRLQVSHYPRPLILAHNGVTPVASLVTG